MTRVIKIGGRPQNDPRLADAISSGWNGGDGRLVLVHGGGDEVSTLQAAFGETSTFVDGRRVKTRVVSPRGRKELEDALAPWLR